MSAWWRTAQRLGGERDGVGGRDGAEPGRELRDEPALRHGSRDRREARLDDASDDSFPASDPPSWTGSASVPIHGDRPTETGHGPEGDATSRG